MFSGDYWGGYNGQNYDGMTKEETIDKFCFNIKANIMTREETIQRLQDELKAAKDEAYASEEMQRMKEELERTKKAYYRGFPISEQEQEQIRAWQKKHDVVAHNNPKHYHGTSGGGYSYIFYPTAIGTSGVIRCDTCAARARKEALIDGEYQVKVFREKMKELNGEFEFQQLG